MIIKPYSRVVVEGMDGSGKSTLLKQLKTHFEDAAVLVPGYNRVEGEKPAIDQWWQEQIAINPGETVIIHDRFFYSEFVYGPILRGTTQGSWPTVEYMKQFLRDRAFLIYCRPPVEVIRSGFKSQPQMEGIAERFNDLLSQYDGLMNEESTFMEGRFFKYDYTDEGDLGELLTMLEGYLY